MAAPLRTPTKIIDWPRKSRVISSPSSATRLAMASRDSNTFRSGIEHHLIREFRCNRKLAGPQAAAELLHPGALGLDGRDARRHTPVPTQELRVRYRMLIHTLPSERFVKLQGIQLTWLGHSTFRIQTPEGKTLYIDPWIAGNPKCPESEKNVKKADVLICTHGHGDHIGDAVDVGKKVNPVAVGIFELCLWLQKKGVKQISPMNKGGTQTVAGVKITMVHAVHSCGIQDGDQIVYGGEACGYVLEFSNGVKL